MMNAKITGLRPPIRTHKAGTILSNKKIYSTPLSTDKTWDICYKFEYPYNILCNFTPSRFKHDGVNINSMEGALQSFKVADEKTQKKICTLPGFMAKKVGNYLKKTGKFDRKTVYWQGKQYDRNSKDFSKLINKVYSSKYEYDSQFRGVLTLSKNRTLTHKIGKSDPTDTILTEDEFITNLNTLRKGQSFKERIKTAFVDVKTHVMPQKNTKVISDKLKKYNATFINDVYICGDNPEISDIKNLKKLGVKNIIDINAAPEEAQIKQELAKKHNLNYTNITLDNHKKVQDPSNIIKKVVNMYNEGEPTYIISTPKNNSNVVFAMNYLYNPEATLPDALMFGTPQKSFLSRVVSLEQDLSEKDETMLGWTKEFKDSIAERKQTLIDINS